jgi:hypothetical protein
VSRRRLARISRAAASLTKQLRAAGVVGLAVTLTAAATAFAGDGGQVKNEFNAADQAAARTAVLHRSDLGSSASRWTGGAKKPSLSGGPRCPNYHPKQSDLVRTGAAESDFKSVDGVSLFSDAQVLQTARMVRLDWQRTIKAPGTVPCWRSYLIKAFGSGAKLVYFAPIAFPHISTYAAAFLMLADVSAVRVMSELVAVGRGRTEITLLAVAPAATQATVLATTERLARILVARARA